MANRSSLKFKRGDSFKRDIQLTDPNKNNTPVSIENWTISCQIRYSSSLAASVTVTVTDAALGEFTLSMDPSITELLVPRTYQCDVEFFLLNGEKVSSETFNIIVEKDITHG